MARGQHGQRGLDSFACAHTIERFVILLYDKTRTSTDADKARCKLFANKNNVLAHTTDKCRPQAAHPTCCVPGRACLGHPAPALRYSTDLGWIKTSDQMYEPLWTTIPEASKVCFKELVPCKCKKGCTKKCKCKNAKPQLKCTALCACEGECSDN